MSSKKKEPTIATIVGLILVAIAFLSFILYSIQKVRAGKGLDYYLTGYGVQMNYIGVLLTFSTIAIALLIGWIIRIWSAKKEHLNAEHFSRKRDDRKKT